MSERGKMTVAEAGRKGGLRTKTLHGHEFYHATGVKGGKATLRKYGPQHYEKIGRKGGKVVGRLIKQAKAVQK